MTSSSSPSEPREVWVREQPIELCQLLKFSGLAGTGGEAKQVISQGLVQLNGAIETRKRCKLRAGDRVSYAGETIVVAVGPESEGGSRGAAR